MDGAAVKKIKIEREEAARLILYFALFFLLGSAKVSANVRPFAFGFFAAALATEKRYLIFPVLFSFALFAAYPTADTLIPYCLPAAILSAFFYLHGKAFKKLNAYFIVFYMCLSSAPYFLYKLGAPEELAGRAVNFILSAVFGEVSRHVLNAVRLRGLRYKLNADELIGVAVIAMAASAGLGNIDIGGVSALRLAAPCALLMCSYVFGGGAAAVSAAVIGLGAAFAAPHYIYFAATFTVGTATSLCFKPLHKTAAAAAFVMADVVLGFYFNVYPLYGAREIVPLALSAAAFCLTPKSAADKLSDLLGGRREKELPRLIVNKSRADLCGKLYEVADVFSEMQRVFSGMVKGVMSAEEAKTAFTKEVCERVCFDCPERFKCWRNRMRETEDAVLQLNEAALNRGKAGLLDLNPYIASYCKRTQNILSAVNELAADYRRYVTMTKNTDTSRALIGEQLGGVARIMKDLADGVKRSVVFSGERERAVAEELSYNGIPCREAVVYGEGADVSVSLLLNRKDAYGAGLSALAGKALKCRVMVTGRENSAYADWTAVTLKPAPAFDLVFAVAGAAKGNASVSGDTHSLIRIGHDKCMLALCDGMGSGAAAERTSSTAIGLIENFYKAGFDNDIILSGVNKLLSVTCEEAFAALDVAAVDLKRGAADFIKLGAPAGFLKTASGVEIVKGGALPAGVLERVEPAISKITLSENEYIIMVTDGISDAFSSSERLADFILSLPADTPQTLSEQILAQALLLNEGVPRDDMTACVVKIIKVS